MIMVMIVIRVVMIMMFDFFFEEICNDKAFVRYKLIKDKNVDVGGCEIGR